MNRAPRLILDDPEMGARVYEAPVAILRADDADTAEKLLRTLPEALAAGRHVAGYLSYELGYVLERRLRPLARRRLDLPLLWLGVFEGFRADRAPHEARSWYAGPLRHEWDEAAYCSRFERVRCLIAAGDLYQANLSFRAGFAFLGEAEAFYRTLKKAAGARHCAFVDDGEWQILSLSPELFFDISCNGFVRTRPMKGTAARGGSPRDDEAMRKVLVSSDKERAENLMIVDLLRNDLSRVSRIGSVKVDRLFEVETYPTLHAMVSTVSARLEAHAGPEDVVRALFPCGSVTGAPKIRAMEVIREVESSPRGVYCGAIGYFAPDGTAAFNVSIRTLTISGNRGELGIGGAVVYDSRPEAEHAECRLKARFFETARRPLELIETLRWAPDEGFARLSLHVSRLERSAAAFDFPFDRGRARDALRAAVSGLRGVTRVRLALNELGSYHAGVEPLGEASCSPWRLTVSPHRVQSRDPLLRHKTTARETFDGEHVRATAAGYDEVLFLNEQGELTEGSRTNLFLERDGGLFTPRPDSGLLDGCLRRELLQAGRCSEARLTLRDLQGADRVYVGNSLRGLIRAKWPVEDG